MSKIDEVTDMARSIATSLVDNRVSGRTVIIIDTLNGGIRSNKIEFYRNVYQARNSDEFAEITEQLLSQA